MTADQKTALEREFKVEWTGRTIRAPDSRDRFGLGRFDDMDLLRDGLDDMDALAAALDIDGPIDRQRPHAPRFVAVRGEDAYVADMLRGNRNRP